MIKVRYWPAEPENGVPASVEILDVRVGAKRKPVPYKYWDKAVDGRKLFSEVESLLQEGGF
jgi:hypothetical protein